MLGIGIIGCGAISKMHIDSFKEMQDVKIVAVSDSFIDSAKRVGDQLGVPYYQNFEDLIARDDIDVVSICTPSGLHKDIAIKCLQAKKNVITEKPIEVTLEKIDEMIKTADENGVKLAGIFNNRFREGNMLVKKAIDSGRLGKLINTNAYIRWYRTPEYYSSSKWRGTWELDGGGALMNQSVHYIDLLWWWTGGIKSVFAYTDTLLHKSIETEDTAVAVLKTNDGALGAIVATTSSYPGFAAKIELTGERGSIVITDGLIEAWSFKDSDPIDEEAKNYMAGGVDNDRASDPMAFSHYYHKKQLEEIIEAFKQGKDSQVNGHEARKAVALIIAIYESAKQNKEIFL